ncbi:MULTISPECIES: hypothetical protein [unclassified Micromonospora]|uniref:hypothetical protein n=1 Tax=unclassified Micromonospora TaxID=2617518 RepID=UPI0022C11B40|nr:hypothetical protein [Micromonospora sp. AKA38]GHJ16442.1 hypothetical protein TPA0908_44370 [Micromonospora sp. AKA38]
MDTSEPQGRERGQTSGRERDGGAEKLNWIDRRREKIRAEIARNRRGDHKVPTWAMAVALVVIVAAWIGLIVFFG